MKTKLQKLITALQLIESKEPNTEFNIASNTLAIGTEDLYTDEEKETLESLWFYVSSEYECFEFST